VLLVRSAPREPASSQPARHRRWREWKAVQGEIASGATPDGCVACYEREQAYTQGIGKVRKTNVLGAVPELADELVPLPADGHAHPPRDRSDATSGVILIVRSPPRSGLA